MNQGEFAELHKNNAENIPQRDHSATIISLKEKKIIKQIRDSSQEGQKNAIKKLVVVSIVCVIFMVAELVGGIISNSVAIQADAAHMLSDFSGFAISMISIIISRRSPTYKLSFGYHRAEVIGTLCSILLIWGLTAWLFHEALDKVVNNEKVDDPLIMLIIGIVGLLANIFMGHILHSVGGHHGHSHGHSHSHGDGHAHSDEKLKNDKKDKKKKPEEKNNAINNVSIMTDTSMSEALLSGDKNDFNNGKQNSKYEKKCSEDHKHEDHHGHSHDHQRNQIHEENHQHSHESHGHDDHHGHSHDNNGHDDDHGDSHDNKNKHSHDDHHGHSHDDKNKHNQDDHHGHSHDDKNQHSHDDQHGHTHDEKHDHLEDDYDHHQENMNIRAAFIHVVGDLLQSVGVVLAAAAILIWPDAYIVDPILTFLFAIIVLFTTIPVLCECIKVFMEGTPTGVDPSKLLADLNSVINNFII
jgi:zinc transporter 2